LCALPDPWSRVSLLASAGEDPFFAAQSLSVATFPLRGYRSSV
jgi:hypothetical protein